MRRFIVLTASLGLLSIGACSGAATGPGGYTLQILETSAHPPVELVGIQVLSNGNPAPAGVPVAAKAQGAVSAVRVQPDGSVTPTDMVTNSYGAIVLSWSPAAVDTLAVCAGADCTPAPLLAWP